MPPIPAKYSMDEQDPTDDDGMDPAPDAGADDLGDPDDGMGDGDGMGEEQDPMVAKVFQSKQWKEMDDKLSMILQALQGEEPGMGGEGGGAPGGDMGAPGAAPPPGPGGPGQAGMPGMDDGMGGEDPDEEMRQAHGEQPVQFSGTGFPGPMSTSIPAMGGKKTTMPATTGKRYQRNGAPAPQNGGSKVSNPELVRMSRRLDAAEKSNQALQLKLSRADALEQITALENAGIVFGDTPEEHAQGKAEEAEFLALLNDEDRAQQIEVMKRRYKRKKADPANPSFPGIARFARMEEKNGTGAASEEYDPETPEQASEFADLLTLKKMSRAEAIKYMRSRR